MSGPVVITAACLALEAEHAAYLTSSITLPDHADYAIDYRDGARVTPSRTSQSLRRFVADDGVRQTPKRTAQ